MLFFVFLEFFLFFFGFGSSKTKKNLGKFWFFEFTVSSKRGKNQKLPRKILFF